MKYKALRCDVQYLENGSPAFNEVQSLVQNADKVPTPPTPLLCAN